MVTPLDCVPCIIEHGLVIVLIDHILHPSINSVVVILVQGMVIALHILNLIRWPEFFRWLRWESKALLMKSLGRIVANCWMGNTGGESSARASLLESRSARTWFYPSTRSVARESGNTANCSIFIFSWWSSKCITSPWTLIIDVSLDGVKCYPPFANLDIRIVFQEHMVSVAIIGMADANSHSDPSNQSFNLHCLLQQNQLLGLQYSKRYLHQLKQWGRCSTKNPPHRDWCLDWILLINILQQLPTIK